MTEWVKFVSVFNRLNAFCELTDITHSAWSFQGNIFCKQFIKQTLKI